MKNILFRVERVAMKMGEEDITKNMWMYTKRRKISGI